MVDVEKQVSKFRLSARSLNNMKGIHPDLFRIVQRAIELTSIDFVVTCGLRTQEQQVKLVAEGKSRTLRSRHLTGHAVDVAALLGATVSWDFPLYQAIARAFKQAAAELELSIEWGGDWESFRDGPHFQLPWSQYPAPSIEGTEGVS